MGKVSSKVFDLDGNVVGRIRLPGVFRTPLRPDVIKRAVLALQSHRLQPQGRDVLAGKRTTAESWGVGLGIARVPRLRDVRRAAFAPGTVGGRATHPPVKEKKIYKKIPHKEKRLALFSAIAATGIRETVAARGHIIDDVLDLPLVATDDLQTLKRTKDVEEAFKNLGVWPDIYRVKESIKVRAGKGKMRGRRKKMAVGPLIVVSENDGIFKAARNIPGVDVSTVRDLNVELLAPGTNPGRLTIWTNSSIEALKEFV
ncbi:MAG: 50S ribosomal protein L4P [Candidatus Bathyarchaeota archaeon B26-2]|nr:MAG: 50S ribosomal protein L4P [Candidatus Bathyarchaeota archaeon B26-2]